MKIAFSPSIYEHAAFLLGRTPWEVSRSAELLFQAHALAYRTYHHSPIVVGIDIYNLEAEAYGCTVERPGGHGIPAITRPLFHSLREARTLQPFDPATAGRLPQVIAAGRELRKAFPQARVCVPVSGPFSIAVSLRGLTGLLTEVGQSPQAVREFLMQLVEGQVRFGRAIVEAGLEVAFFESAAAPPLLSPRQFREVELPALKEALVRVGEVAGQPLPCIIGGDTEPILEEILSTGTRFVICPAETDAEAFLARLGQRQEVQVRVNLDPRTVASGSRTEILAAVDRVLELAQGRPNILLGTGAVPYETPPENILLIRDYAAS
jgi:uroporphyrinogen decarboxylase